MGRRFLALLVLAAAGCETPAPEETPKAEPERAPVVFGAALVEWQFPTAVTDGFRVDPLQERLCRDETQARLWPAFYPRLSEENANEGERGLARLVNHAKQVNLAYAAGREQLDWPFLLNISNATPDALRALIDHGVRIVSFSVGSKSRLSGLDDVIREHPEVLFVASTPHISGNSISVEALDERPSVLATRGYPNVILAGCLEYYEDDIDAHRAGRALGTKDTPFHIVNQPVAPTTRQYFMMTGHSTRAFAEGFGGSSAAAVHLASLLSMILAHRSALGRTTTAQDLLAELDRVTHAALAREKSGDIHEIRFFTLDTILLNARRPLITEAIWWGGLTGYPEPIAFAR